MPTPPPSQDQVLALAERALAHLDGEGQVTAWWERGMRVQPEPGDVCAVADVLAVEVVAIEGDRSASVQTTHVDDDGLARAARGARQRARTAGPSAAGAGLPEPAAGRGHDAYDPAIANADPAQVAADLAAACPPGVTASLVAAAARTAIASTRGVRAVEQRSFAEVEVVAAGDGGTAAPAAVGGRSVALTAAATSLAGLPTAALAAEALELLGSGQPAPVPAGEPVLVLGPDAVAAVLERLAPHFGVLAALGESAVAERLGSRVAASAISLSDSPRFPSTLARSYDVEGAPRLPTPLIQDGVAHRLVHDSASAARAGTATTGHAPAAGRLGPLPRHLVLVGGGAADLAELAAPVERGLLIPAFADDGAGGLRTRGAVRIEGGALAGPAADAPVALDPLAVLASVQAVSMRQRTIAAGERSARLVGATVAPSLRAGAGVRVLG